MFGAVPAVLGGLEAVLVAVHFAFLGLLVLGGFAGCRHPVVLAAHGAMVAWGATSVLFVWDCPLTDLQQAVRAAAGRPPLAGGFIDTYVSGVLVPTGADGPVQLAAGAVVLTSWVLLARDARRRRGPNPVTPGAPARR